MQQMSEFVSIMSCVYFERNATTIAWRTPISHMSRWHQSLSRCNHRAAGGVRITASLFIAEIVPASLEQVGSHE